MVFALKLRCLPNLRQFSFTTWMAVSQAGKEDKRRVFHSLKVGFSLTLVSLLYLLEPLFKGIGQNAMWAVMTVVVVLEFTAGATLCKGLNRGLGTLMAGSLAFLIQYIAQEAGHVIRAIFIATTVFVLGTVSTYVRFLPYIKRNYDYGVVIFLLTFNLIIVSSFRVENVLQIAKQRVYMIGIGCGICLLMTLMVFPNWSGQQLHNSMVAKLEGLAKSIQGCVDVYFSEEEHKHKNGDREKNSEEIPIYKGYEAVLDSKSADEALALYASWEPRHCPKLPWQQYVKLGDVLRSFGYIIVALQGCLHTEIQTPLSVRALFKDPCTRLAGEVSKALMQLASGIRNRRQCSPKILSDHLHQALQDLTAALKTQPRLFLSPMASANTDIVALAAASAAGKNSLRDAAVSLASFKTDSSALVEWKKARRAVAAAAAGDKEAERKMLRPTLSKMAITSLEFSEALPFAAFASLLVEAVAKLDLVIEEVEELGTVANFREFCEGEDEAQRKPETGGVATAGNHLHTHLAEC